MGENAQYLREEAAAIMHDVFGGPTTILFKKAIDDKPPKEIVILMRELLTDYLGDEKSRETIELLSQRYGLK
jgi:hypothetical protein